MIKPMTLIKGNNNLKIRLCDEILSGKMAHAYILSGSHGSGKYSIALMSAAALECENKGRDGFSLPCLSCTTCKKILSGNSPDIYTVQKDGMSVKIDKIRELSKSVRFLPNELEHKFYIIEDAHTMTPEAQNALLLTLEEPPSYIIFFLLCESEEKLLETIKSRAPILRTEPLPRNIIKTHLLESSDDARKLYEASPSEFDSIISISDGAIGKALELMDEKTRQPLIKQRERAERLVEYTITKNPARLIELLMSIPQKQDEIIPILTHTETALRDLILLKKSPDAELCFYGNKDTAIEISYSTGISSIMSIYDKIGIAKELLSRNANVKLTITSLISNIL